MTIDLPLNGERPRFECALLNTRLTVEPSDDGTGHARFVPDDGQAADQTADRFALRERTPDGGGPPVITLEERRTESPEPGVLEVRLPESVQLRIRSRNGSVTVRDLHGQLKVRTRNGSIHVHGFHGRVQAAAANGSLLLDALEAPYLEAATSNGKIRLAASRVGGGTVRSANGRIALQLAPLGEPAGHAGAAGAVAAGDAGSEGVGRGGVEAPADSGAGAGEATDRGREHGPAPGGGAGDARGAGTARGADAASPTGAPDGAADAGGTGTGDGGTADPVGGAGGASDPGRSGDASGASDSGGGDSPGGSGPGGPGRSGGPESAGDPAGDPAGPGKLAVYSANGGVTLALPEQINATLKVRTMGAMHSSLAGARSQSEGGVTTLRFGAEAPELLILINNLRGGVRVMHYADFDTRRTDDEDEFFRHDPRQHGVWFDVDFSEEFPRFMRDMKQFGMKFGRLGEEVSREMRRAFRFGGPGAHRDHHHEHGGQRRDERPAEEAGRAGSDAGERPQPDTSAEVKTVLDLLQQGKISVEDAEKLIAALRR